MCIILSNPRLKSKKILGRIFLKDLEQCSRAELRKQEINKSQVNLVSSMEQFQFSWRLFEESACSCSNSDEVQFVRSLLGIYSPAGADVKTMRKIVNFGLQFSDRRGKK